MNQTDKVSVASPPFRQGTLLGKTHVSFVYNAGGIGDYINWTTAIQYAITANPHIHGLIIAPHYFYDLAEYWLGNFSSRYKVIETIDFNKDKIIENVESAWIIPDGKQFANACGFSLFQLGFAYYSQIDRVPHGWAKLPEINPVYVWPEGLPKDYAVITTEATAENRVLEAETTNQIIEHLLSKNITPIFLGKKSITSDYSSSASSGIDFHKGKDLREKTSLRQAAGIMSKARLVLGIDNGLLHLACCSDVPVIFGFTNVEPRHRVPPRKAGTKTVIVTPKEELTCRFCQSNMRFVIGHKFDKCLYGDNLCVKMIDGPSMIAAIDKILGEKNANEI